MKIGDKLKGVITGIKPYGAFVSLENGTTGLIHISEIKTGYIDNIYNTLKVDQDVLVQVVDFDEFTQKASLSLRTLEEEKNKIPHRHRFSDSRLNLSANEKVLNLIEDPCVFIKHQNRAILLVCV